MNQLRSAGASAAKTKGRPGRKPKTGITCSEKGCSLPARSKGLCSNHYQQARYEEKKGADKPAKPAKAGKRGRPPKAAMKVVAEKKSSKRIAPKKKAPKKVAPKEAKLALVPETPAPAPEARE